MKISKVGTAASVKRRFSQFPYAQLKAAYRNSVSPIPMNRESDWEGSEGAESNRLDVGDNSAAFSLKFPFAV